MKTGHIQVLARGFTLIEMLVVLVIISMTTVLLTEGLGTTWRNFERLGARDLTVSSAHLPVSWFAQSVRGAVLYHPDTVMVEGERDSFLFHTFKAPADDRGIIQQVEWSIIPQQSHWVLALTSQSNEDEIIIAQFTEQAVFEYLRAGEWHTEFKPKAAELPLAVRIRHGEIIWAIAKIGRPEKAAVPPELAAFGKYEF